ncbi:DUF6503 family protein [Aegicerativicinus sediminis]|uniref:DUF6503 family protein n=1 Tax=Aegicerativicinus sediminis TaxID=2893202 RepID=UPI001E414C7F|nr:DUF6503 family protein [Aegicerativicinus sediminis]
MKIKSSLLVVPLFFLIFNCGPDKSDGENVIKNSIYFHDPQNNWSTFNDSLKIELQMADGTKRFSEIAINLPENYFSLNATKDSTTSSFIVDGTKCILKLNGMENFSANDSLKHNMTCERAFRYKDYYEYLYGLPMKLMDRGTQIHSSESVTFKGKDYIKVNVSYDKNVGSDIWNFYFNPKNYALEAYQFYKTDETSGGIIPDSGEYILLDELTTISGIKIPKNRKWYYNKNGSFLGEDVLK